MISWNIFYYLDRREPYHTPHNVEHALQAPEPSARPLRGAAAQHGTRNRHENAAQRLHAHARLGRSATAVRARTMQTPVATQRKRTMAQKMSSGIRRKLMACLWKTTSLVPDPGRIQHSYCFPGLYVRR